MTGPWGLRETGMCVGAVILALSIAYLSGKHAGQLDARLSINAEQLKKSDDSVKRVQIRNDSAKARSDVLDKKYDVIRTKVRVVHDTTFLPGDSAGTVDTVTNKTLAKLIHSADSSKVAHKEERAVSDALVASLRVGLDLRDKRIALLESRGTQRFSKGLQVGVGYCQTASSRQPCVYVGYGIQIGLP